MPLMVNLKKKIYNKVAIVTGAGSGIGKAVALGLAREGVDIYLAGRKKEKLLITKQQSIKENNRGNCHIIKCDVTEETAVRKLFLLIHKQHGRIDLLFIPRSVVQRVFFLINKNKTMSTKKVSLRLDQISITKWLSHS